MSLLAEEVITPGAFHPVGQKGGCLGWPFWMGAAHLITLHAISPICFASSSVPVRHRQRWILPKCNAGFSKNKAIPKSLCADFFHYNYWCLTKWHLNFFDIININLAPERGATIWLCIRTLKFSCRTLDYKNEKFLQLSARKAHTRQRHPKKSFKHTFINFKHLK